MKPTLVKIFLVLNLLLCAGALGFGIKVFQDRELIKARTVLLENTTERIAETLNWGASVDWEEEASPAGPFKLELPEKLAEIDSFEGKLEELSQLADRRVNQLTQHFEELGQVRRVLAERQADLDAMSQELIEARNEINSLEGELADVREKDVRQTIITLETEKSNLERQVENLRSELETQDGTLANLEEKLSQITEERDRIQALLDACRSPADLDPTKGDWYQKTAKILAVDPEWDYVVINKGEVDVLPMYLEAFVHRGDEFIGKVRVMRVERNVALAEILEETIVEGEQIKPGDTIFF